MCYTQYMGKRVKEGRVFFFDSGVEIEVALMKIRGKKTSWEATLETETIYILTRHLHPTLKSAIHEIRTERAAHVLSVLQGEKRRKYEKESTPF